MPNATQDQLTGQYHGNDYLDGRSGNDTSIVHTADASAR